MLAGWVPYIIGCLLLTNQAEAIDKAATNVLLCGAAAGLAALLLGHYRFGKPDVALTLIGFLGGLVASAAGAGSFGSIPAVFVGAVAGVITPLCAIWIDLLGKIDDPVAAIAIHGVGGLQGTLAGPRIPLAGNLLPSTGPKSGFN